jgi:hypothetical protein
MGELIQSKRLALVGIVLATAVELLIIFAETGSLGLASALMLLFILEGALPFGLGFLVQSVLRHREIPDFWVWLAGFALMVPWLLWGQGFAAVSVRGPRILTVAISVVFLSWFGGLGTAAARSFRARRLAKATAAPRPEA